MKMPLCGCVPIQKYAPDTLRMAKDAASRVTELERTPNCSLQPGRIVIEIFSHITDLSRWWIPTAPQSSAESDRIQLWPPMSACAMRAFAVVRRKMGGMVAAPDTTRCSLGMWSM
jgi:hypothetical protein